MIRLYRGPAAVAERARRSGQTPPSESVRRGVDTARRLLSNPRAVLLLFVLLTTGLFIRAWVAPRTNWVGGLYDPEQTIWYLAWMPHAIAHGANPLLTDFVNAPQGANLMWNTAMPLAALILSPITVLLGPVFAYNVLVTAGVALSGWCCWLLLRRFARGVAAPLAGGLLYGYGAFVLGQAQDHANLCFAAIPPLLVMALHSLLRTGDPRRRLGAGVSLGALAAAQVMLNEEMLAIETVGMAVLVVILAVAHREVLRASVRRSLRPLAAAALVFAFLAAVPLGVEFLGPNRVEGQILPRGATVTDVGNVVVPTQLQAASPEAAVSLSESFSSDVAEADAYLGIPLLLICGWVVLRRRTRHVHVTAAMGGAALVLSCGESLHVFGIATGIPMPWRLLEQLPLLTNLAPARFGLVVDLCAAMLLAEFVAEIVPLHRASRTVPVLLLLTVLSLFPVTPFLAASRDVPAFFTGGAGLQRIPAGSTALVLPLAYGLDADAMLWQAEAGMRFRMADGYLYVPPPPGQRPANHPQNAIQHLVDEALATPAKPWSPADVAAARADLTRLGVSTVIVGPCPDHDLQMRVVEALLPGRAPEHLQGVDVWYSTAAGSG